MANFNPTDQIVALCAETVPGTPNATPTFLKVDRLAGDELQSTNDFVESNVIRSSRSSAGGRKYNFGTGGSLKTEFFRDAAVDLLIQSVLSGTWSSNVIKGGTTDTSFTYEKTYVDTTGTKQYWRAAGCQGTKLSLSCEASGMSSFSADILGYKDIVSTATMITGATYTNPSSTTKLCGLDITSVSVAGLTAPDFRKLELTVDQPREILDRFGNSGGRGIGASGMRKVSLSLEFYRSDWIPETLTSDTPIAVSFTIGGTGTGYTISLPAANITNRPQNSGDGAKQIVRMDFIGAEDSGTGTNIQITRL